MKLVSATKIGCSTKSQKKQRAQIRIVILALVSFLLGVAATAVWFHLVSKGTVGSSSSQVTRPASPPIDQEAAALASRTNSPAGAFVRHPVPVPPAAIEEVKRALPNYASLSIDQGMSKTLGNVVTPIDIVDVYGPDALRYYLLRENSFGKDGNFTWENFLERYNGDLANDFGNLLQRVLTMIRRYRSGQIPSPNHLDMEDEALKADCLGLFEDVRDFLDPLGGDQTVRYQRAAHHSRTGRCA